MIELLISIVVLSLVLAIGLPSLHGAIHTARAAKCLGNIRDAGTVAASFAMDHRELPPHFPIDPVLTDELGVPLIRIEHLRFTVSRNYFDQTGLWIRALRPPAEPVPRHLTCTGVGYITGSSTDPDQHAFTSYTLSAALLADPRLFEDDLVMPLDPSWFRPQALHRVLFPGDKAMLSEQTVAHGTGEYADVLETRSRAAPVVFVDGHAKSASFDGVPAVRTAPDGVSPRPYSHTPRGILGRDVPAPTLGANAP